ncbi:MAG TPA: S9 family peptidase [Bacteroidia bacterium]|nr:S9 family peptidase [Bacteroidia bacterium]
MFHKKSILLSLFSVFVYCSSLVAQVTMQPEHLFEFKRQSEISLSPDGKTIAFVIESINLSENKGNKDIYILSVNGGNVTQITKDAGNEFSPQWNSDGSRLGYLSSESGVVQWYEVNPDGSNKKQVTFFENGINSFLYSKNPNRVLYCADTKTRNDVHDIYKDAPKSTAIISDDLFYRNWSSWEDNLNAHLFCAELKNGILDTSTATDLLVNEPYDVESYDISVDGNNIAYSAKKMTGKNFGLSTNNEIYLYSLNNRQSKCISEGLPGYDLFPKFSPSGKYLAWNSMLQDGNEADVSNLQRYTLATQSREVAVENFGETIGDYCWSKDENSFYFLVEQEGSVQLFSSLLKAKKAIQLTKGYQQYASLTLAGSDILSFKSTFSMPDELVKIHLKSGLETQLTFSNKFLLDKLKFGKVENNWIRSSDGQKVQTWVFFPPDFTAASKYPTLLYCQGGPQVGITQSFSYRWNLQLMCAQGYIVVAPNRRGVPGFGKAWKDQISEDYGGQSIRDYIAAIDSISKRTYVDTARIAAVGASYGGYSVYWLAGHNQNHRFKSFIAHCGLFNLESWYSMTDQTFFANHELGGAYWKEPKLKSYGEFSPHLFVKNWDTPILVIHGEKDFRVPVSEGMQAFGSAQLKNIKSRFLYFPDEGHWVLKPQNSLVWHREFYRWLKETLN